LKKKLLIINTGGTISSVKTPQGYAPKPGFVKAALKAIPQLVHPDMPDYDLLEISPLIDSSNITVDDWNILAKLIADNYSHYDGFVIFHGTDTMAYTASALSFMLENLAKPVVITGSQIPLSEIRNDAMENIIASVWLAAKHALNEVVIYFNQRLLRGTRAQKVSAHRFSAFDSPNFSHLAEVGIHIEIKQRLLQPKPQEKFNCVTLTSHFIANFRLFPGFATQVLQQILNQPLRGLILESYGIGNAQNNDPLFLDTLNKASQNGVIIVNCSQCHQARVDMQSYATGQTLLQAGVISGFDMTPEAAHCKLLYLLSKGHATDKIKHLMQHPLCGELTS